MRRFTQFIKTFLSSSKLLLKLFYDHQGNKSITKARAKAKKIKLIKLFLLTIGLAQMNNSNTDLYFLSAKRAAIDGFFDGLINGGWTGN